MSAVGFGNLCAFLMALSQYAFAVGLPYLVIDRFEVVEWQLGLLGGLGAASYTVTAMYAGRIGARFRRHHLMVFGAILIAVTVALVPFSPSIWVVVALMVLAGCGQAIFWPALEAFLADGVGPTELRSRIGGFNLSWSSGDTLGAFAGGALFGLAVWLKQYFEIPMLQGAPCLLVAAVMGCVAVIVLARLHTQPTRNHALTQHDHKVPKSPGRGGHSSLGVFWTMALISNFAAMGLRGTMMNVFPALGKGELHFSEVSWGVLLGTTSLMRTLGFAYWQYRHAWEYRAGYFFWMQMLLPLSALAFIFNSNYWVFLVIFALTGIGISKTYFASIFYSMDSEHSHSERGGIHEAVLGAGYVLPLMTGFLPSMTGSQRSPYVFLFGLLSLGILVQVVMYLRSRSAKS